MKRDRSCGVVESEHQDYYVSRHRDTKCVKDFPFLVSFPKRSEDLRWILPIISTTTTVTDSSSSSKKRLPKRPGPSTQQFQTEGRTGWEMVYKTFLQRHRRKFLYIETHHVTSYDQVSGQEKCVCRRGNLSWVSTHPTFLCSSPRVPGK